MSQAGCQTAARVQAVGAGLLVLLSAGILAGCFAPAAPPVVRRASDLRSLSPRQLARGAPVQLRGVVTVADLNWGLMAVQDDTGGVFLDQPAMAPGIQHGDEVEVEGATAFDSRTPSVVNARVRALGQRGLPEPLRVSLEEAVSGRFDGRRVEVVFRPTASRAADSSHGIYMEGTAAGRKVVVIGLVYRRGAVELLRGRRLRLRGVPVTQYSPRGDHDQRRIYLDSEADIDLLDAAPVQPAAAGGSAAALTSIAAVKSLSREEAALGRRAVVQGTVVVNDVRNSAVILQDSDLAIYLRHTRTDAPLQEGQRVRVEGITAPGGFAPIIAEARITVLGRGPMPEPLRAAAGVPFGGREENRWSEVEGLAAAVTPDVHSPNLVLFSGTRRIAVRFARNDAPELLRSLLNSRVAVRGAYSPVFTGTGSLTSFRMISPEPGMVRILEPAPAELETRTISSLLRFDLRGLPKRRVRVSGTVTYSDSTGRVYLQDGESPLRLGNNGPAAARVNETVVVDGVLAPETRMPRLEEVHWSGEAPGKGVEPVQVLAEAGLTGDLDGRLVAVDGQLESRRTAGGDLQLSLVAGRTRFIARMEQPDAGGALPEARPGAMLRVTGICETQAGWGAVGTRLMAVLMRTPGDVRILEPAPWWDLQRALYAAFAASGTLVLALLWVMHLRRRLVRQMALRSRLEAQLLHAQKLESVGRLAGGVAHDFNNYLTVILGYADLLLGRLAEGDPAQAGLQAIRDVGEKAANLTRQLLAFSRKQVMQPVRCDLNDVLEQARSTLLPLIGEHIELVTLPAPQLNPVIIDPAQFTQVIVNLAVNARDAMAEGGKLMLETSEVELGQDYVRRHPDVRAGRYVQFSVTDSGHGMDEETRRRIFEPFFTTKERGRGTGLGLAVVFGIVNQSGGHIQVYSEPGHGTSFKIYLPVAGSPAAAASKGPAPARLQGTETVLVVEDQAEVRSLVCTGLRGYGYRVLQAPSPEAALQLLEAEAGEIHLLVTDVVMPGMNGRALALKVQALRPGIRVLYMSGYTENVVVHQGVLDPGLAYIQKPFGPAALAAAVRRVLDQPAG